MYPFYYIDAFTDTPFEGNPCAVFPKADGLSEEEMGKIAMETNLPETSFVLESERADFRVRYFTPRGEIPFAGHPTIATAFLLAREGRIRLSGESTVVQFEFNIGVLPVRVLTRPDGSIEMVGMEQKPPVFADTVDAGELAGALGLPEADFLPSAPCQVVSTGVAFLIVPLKRLDAVKAAEMDRPRARKALRGVGVSAMFVCAPQGFTSGGNTFARLLDPDNAGEDPYTGSATGCMGSLLYRCGVIDSPRMVCEQGHLLGRPGSGVLELEGTPEDIQAVRLFGKAAASLSGRYR